MVVQFHRVERIALEAHAYFAEHRFIVTVPGRGYQFVAQVRMDCARGYDGKALLTSAEVPSCESATATSVGGFRKNPVPWIVSGITALALMGLFAWIFRPQAHTPGSKVATAQAIPAPHSIAILPFADLSPARDMEYFTDGITEELMNSLARAGSLRVIGRRSALAFKGTNEDARSIGERLKVDSILEGSVRKAGERIRISARLVRIKDGFSLWSETYDRRLGDVLDIQSAIASEVAAALSPMINPVTGRRASLIGEAPTKNPDAYDAYLRGVSLFQRFTYSEVRPARDQFLRAVELDPQFALAHAWLASSYDQLARSGLGNTVENRSLAAASLDRAIKLDPRIADLWWVQMWLGNADSASLTLRINNFERALKDSPENALLMGELATAYMRVGRRAEALDLWERARYVDPLWVPAIDAFAFTTYLYRGDRQRAVELIEEMEGLATDDPRPAELRAQMAFSEGRALDWDHWKAKAIELAPRDPPLHGYLSLDYGHLGIMDAARYHARRAHRTEPGLSSKSAGMRR